MKTNIIPHKLLINFNEDGTFLDGILMYQVQEDTGSVSSKYNTISVKSEFNVAAINIIIQKAITFAKKQEGIND